MSGVLVGRGVLRNPWILAEAADIAAGRNPRRVTLQDRGQFLLEYVDLLLNERRNEADGFRHLPPGSDDPEASGQSRPGRDARSRERWVINKVRALCSWYSKGLDGGSSLRIAVNRAETLVQLRAIVTEFFLAARQDVAPDENLSPVR